MPSAFTNTTPTTTDGTVVAARAGTKIRVYSFYVWAGGTATNITFNSKGSGAGTAISPLHAAASNAGGSFAHNPKGWFTTLPGEGLSITTGSGSNVGVNVVYEFLPV